MKFRSVFSSQLAACLEEKSGALSESYMKNFGRALVSFDAYCAESRRKTDGLTEELVAGWLSGQLSKSSGWRNQCGIAARQFAMHLLKTGNAAYAPPVARKAAQPAQKAFESCLRDSIRGLLESKRARGYKYGALNECGILKRIDAFCVREGLAKDELPRWFVEKWAERTGGEGLKSRANRIVVMRQLAMHMASQGKAAHVAEAVPFPRSPFPYVPDEREMAALFAEIDSQRNRRPWSDCALPALFRLLLASGMRVSEACTLKAEGAAVFLEDRCVISIDDAKGHKDRRVYLEGEIFMLLKRYDEKMSLLMPGREWFFPSDCSPRKAHMAASMARRRFNAAREKVFGRSPDRKPTVHCLRHAFIIWTLRKWRSEQLDIGKMLPYLSKHLGHSSIQETFTYYDHCGQDCERIRADSESFNGMVPEVRHGE
jgi:integrase